MDYDESGALVGMVLVNVRFLDERGYDEGWRFVEVYDHTQPPPGIEVGAIEALAARRRIVLADIRAIALRMTGWRTRVRTLESSRWVSAMLARDGRDRLERAGQGTS